MNVNVLMFLIVGGEHIDLNKELHSLDLLWKEVEENRAHAIKLYKTYLEMLPDMHPFKKYSSMF